MTLEEEDSLSWIKQLAIFGLLLEGGFALDHMINYGRWYDEDKDECHGKTGLILFALSGLTLFVYNFKSSEDGLRKK